MTVVARIVTAGLVVAVLVEIVLCVASHRPLPYDTFDIFRESLFRTEVAA